MRTSTPLLHSSSPTVRKPAFKRRRLNHTIDPVCQSGRALLDNSNVASTLNVLPSAVCAKLSCSTCHRALSTAIRAGVAGLSVCSRCSAPTCAICSRTCTSYTRLSSFPPTPALTRSPSPATHIDTPISPRRTALGLSYATMNCDASVPSVKRKQAPIEKGNADDGDLDSSAGCDRCDIMSAHDDVVIPGCGRVVCRACCIESVVNDGKLCVDCFAFM